MLVLPSTAPMLPTWKLPLYRCCLDQKSTQTVQVCCQSHHVYPNPSRSEVKCPQEAELWAGTWEWPFPPPCWTISGDPLQLIFPTYRKSASMLRSLQSALSSTNSQVPVQRQTLLNAGLLVAQELQLDVWILIQPLMQPSVKL